MEPDDDLDDVSYLLSSALDAFKSPEFNRLMSHTPETPGHSSSTSPAIGESNSFTHQSQTPEIAVPSARSSSPDSLIDPSLRPVTQDRSLLTEFNSTDGMSDVQDSGPRTSTQFRPSTGGKQPKAVYERQTADPDSSNSSDDEDEDSESEDTQPSYSQFANSMVQKYGLPNDMAEDVRKFAQVRIFSHRCMFTHFTLCLLVHYYICFKVSPIVDNECQHHS